MPTYSFSPFGNAQFLDSNGNLAVGYKLFTYLAGTSTKEATYADVSGTPQSNPIVLNAIGRPSSPIFLDYTKNYKFVVAAPADSDPPTSPLYTADNVSVKVPNGSMLEGILLNSPVITLGTVAADPVDALGIASKGYVNRSVWGRIYGNVNI